MLTQLARVSLDADGRFATATELQFIKDYLESADHRISAYEKIRDAEEQIIDQIEEKALAKNARVFHKGTRDMVKTCRRDRKHLLKSSAAAMLVSDLDRLRDSMLLWQRTLINAFQDQQTSQIVSQVMPKVMEQQLTPEEAKQMTPALQLSQALLS
ncbi:MAG: allophycocyanin [Cyanobacteria bacterium P01_A01_bin.17]